MQVQEQTFAAAQGGDPIALEQLLVQLRPNILRYARRQCHASSAIEDVVQEALLILYRRVGTVRSAAALGAWASQSGCAVMYAARPDADEGRRGTQDCRELVSLCHDASG